MSHETHAQTIARNMGLTPPGPDDAVLTFRAPRTEPAPAPAPAKPTTPLPAEEQGEGDLPVSPSPAPFQMAGLSSELAEQALKRLSTEAPTAHKNLLSDEFIANVKVGQRTPQEGLTGRDLNLANIGGEEDLETLIEQVSEVFAAPITKARRGEKVGEKIKDPDQRAVQTNKVTQELAAAMNLPPETIFKRKSGEVWNAEQMLAARNIYVAVSQQTADLAKAINAGQGGEDGIVQLRRNLAIMATMQAQIKGATTEIARSLQAMRITAKPGNLRSAQIEDIIQAGALQISS